MSKEMRKEIISWIIVVVGAVFFSFVLTRCVIVHANVPTGSMMDTVPEKSRVVGNRLAYLFGEPERFDVVAFLYPDDESQIFLKRIIGLPGETLEIVDGKVYINNSDEPLDDSFIREQSHDNWGPFIIPDGCYFMMGDNRTNSHDSRFWQHTFVDRDKILGKVFFSYYPKVKWIR